MHMPGIKVVIPSTPHDAKGLLKTAIRQPDPVLFFEHAMAYYGVKGPVPEEEYTIPFGAAEVKREGKDITIVAYQMMVDKALEAAEILAEQGYHLHSLLTLRELLEILAQHEAISTRQHAEVLDYLEAQPLG